jgi:hypothetical protein
MASLGEGGEDEPNEITGNRKDYNNETEGSEEKEDKGGEGAHKTGGVAPFSPQRCDASNRHVISMCLKKERLDIFLIAGNGVSRLAQKSRSANGWIGSFDFDTDYLQSREKSAVEVKE